MSLSPYHFLIFHHPLSPMCPRAHSLLAVSDVPLYLCNEPIVLLATFKTLLSVLLTGSKIGFIFEFNQ